MSDIIYEEKIKHFRKPLNYIVYTPSVLLLVMSIIVLLTNRGSLGSMIFTLIFFVIPLFLGITKFLPRFVHYTVTVENDNLRLRLGLNHKLLPLLQIKNIEITEVNNASLFDFAAVIFPFASPSRFIMGNGSAVKIIQMDGSSLTFSSDKPESVAQVITNFLLTRGRA